MDLLRREGAVDDVQFVDGALEMFRTLVGGAAEPEQVVGRGFRRAGALERAAVRDAVEAPVDVLADLDFFGVATRGREDDGDVVPLFIADGALANDGSAGEGGAERAD